MSDSPTQGDHELGLVRFIRPERRQRWEGFLSNPKHRKKFTAALDHFRDWDARYAKMQVGAEGLSDRILTTLRSLGAPQICWRISRYPSHDAQSRDLQECLVNGFDSTILSCIPGKLALYIGEYGDVQVLSRAERG